MRFMDEHVLISAANIRVINLASFRSLKLGARVDIPSRVL